MKINQNHIHGIAPFYDVLVVGGGITGAGVFRDMALHGLTTLLIDKGDFAAQTSHRSSRMLHGGIRYLETYDFGLVWEALHEKNLWLKLTPHLCEERKFHLPVFKDSKYPLWMTACGLMLYDFLSGYKNTPHKILSKTQLLSEFPELQSDGLKGAGVYYDVVVEDNKLALECIFDGVHAGGKALNYFELVSFHDNGNEVEVTIKDTLTGETQNIQTKKVVFATGPFTDTIMKKLSIPWEPRVLPSKGIHLWLKKNSLQMTNPLVIQTKDARLVFVIPDKNAILVGTTEAMTDDDMFNIKANENEVDYLLEQLHSYFPKSKIKKEDIIGTYAGIRPLIREGGKNAHKTSRVHKNIQVTQNAYSIIGGKLTTFRSMAQSLCKSIIPMLGIEYDKTLTLSAPRQRSIMAKDSCNYDNAIIQRIIDFELTRTPEDVVYRRMNIINQDEANKLLNSYER